MTAVKARFNEFPPSKFPAKVNSLNSGSCRDLELVSSLMRVRNSRSLFQSNLMTGVVIYNYIFFCLLLGVCLNMWRFDSQTKKLYISRSFVFSNPQVSYIVM